MVSRSAAELRSEHGPAGVGQLLGVYSWLQAQDFSGLQNPPGRLDGERSHVTEGIATRREHRAHREHLVYEHVDIAGLGIEVRPEESRNQFGCGESACCSYSLEGAHLGLGVEPVARFDFDGRRPAVEALVGTL